MKTYNSPMLHVVGINNNDIITMSTYNVYDPTKPTLAPGQRGLDDYYEGY